MSHIAIAAGSQLGADAGAAVAELGGNAIDAAVASALVLMTSEPGVCAPGAGGFITARLAGQRPVTIDANVAMPGLGVDPDRFGVSTRSVTIGYGGGVTTTVGYESVGVPGGMAGLGAAWKAWGSAPWSVVVGPAADLASTGAPLSTAARLYLEYSHDAIFGWHPISRAALHDAKGNLLPTGANVLVPGLADSLNALGAIGAGDMYHGALAQVLAEDLSQGGSLVTGADLSAYAPEQRPAVECTFDNWTIYTNPPPSIGGVTLAAMLQLATVDGNNAPSVRDLIASQHAILSYRRDHLDTAEHLEPATQSLLDRLVDDDGTIWRSSPSTVHVSAVGDDGAACALTMSAGYGSGVIAGTTGFWMNNSLGETELNRRGFHGLSIGTRLPSNMAPTIAIHDDGAVLAIGSPGADRITTALQQVLIRVARGESLQDAVDAPRLHVETHSTGSVVAYEMGLDMPSDVESRRFDEPHMFFGGVALAQFDPSSGLAGAADGRRTGGVVIT